MQLRRCGVAVVLVVALVMLPGAARGQEGNLLRQGSFEDEYTNRGRPDLNTPSAWGLWLAETPREEEWQNRADRTFAFPHILRPEVHSGEAAQNISGGFVTFTAALYQQTRVPTGAAVRASAWAWIHTCNFPRNAENEVVAGVCDSSPASRARVRVGIDPNGGVDPRGPDIVWSEPAFPHDRWERVSVEATASGPFVTVFLYSTQDTPTDLNNVYWDDAALVVTEAGSPVSRSQAGLSFAVAGLPVPQEPQPDGALMHSVRPGDTLDGIALVYGVSRAHLLALNPLPDPRVLRVGQRIRVR